MGRRWDQMKRSNSSELLSVSRRRRRWSPHRKSGCDEAMIEKENVMSTERDTYLNTRCVQQRANYNVNLNNSLSRVIASLSDQKEFLEWNR